jgi:MFS family permease
MALLPVVLALFLAGGVAQALMAGRLVDLIHGGPGRRGPRGRRMDVLVLRVAGWFVAAVAGIALVVLGASGELG